MLKVGKQLIVYNLSVLNLNMAVAKVYLEYFQLKMTKNKMTAI